MVPSQRFFELYAQQTTAVSISAAAERLGVKTRRIYGAPPCINALSLWHLTRVHRCRCCECA
jgi:hypothetical protein